MLTGGEVCRAHTRNFSMSLVHLPLLPKQLDTPILPTQAATVTNTTTIHDRQLTFAQPQGGKFNFMQQAPPNQRNLESFPVAHQSKLQEVLSPQVLQQQPTQSHTACKYCHCFNLQETLPRQGSCQHPLQHYIQLSVSDQLLTQSMKQQMPTDVHISGATLLATSYTLILNAQLTMLYFLVATGLPTWAMLTCNAWFSVLHFLAPVSQAAHWADHNSSSRGEHLVCLEGFFKGHCPFFHRVALGGCQLQYRAAGDTRKNGALQGRRLP